MTESTHIEELRRRVLEDPASIAFAQLAEELRRAGDLEEAIRVCRTGLERHPSYISAHVTLGRALLQLGQHDAAFAALDFVRRAAPRNLAALRGLADIHRQRQQYGDAASLYRAALALAPNDPELESAMDAMAPHLRSQEQATASRATRTIAILEQWLAAIHVTRTQRHA